MYGMLEVVKICGWSGNVWSGEHEWGDKGKVAKQANESEWSRDDEWGGKAKRGEWGGMSGETRSLRRITAMVIIL